MTSHNNIMKEGDVVRLRRRVEWHPTHTHEVFTQEKGSLWRLDELSNDGTRVRTATNLRDGYSYRGLGFLEGTFEPLPKPTWSTV
jgi:hypothetical protein